MSSTAEDFLEARSSALPVIAGALNVRQVSRGLLSLIRRSGGTTAYPFWSFCLLQSVHSTKMVPYVLQYSEAAFQQPFHLGHLIAW